MNCRKAQLLMATGALYEEVLSKTERKSLNVHLQTCPTCAEEYRQSEQVIRVLQGMPESLLRQALAGKLPPAASEVQAVRIHGFGRTVTAQAQSPPPWRLRVVPYVCRAGAMAAAVALCFWLGSGAEYGQRPTGDRNLVDNVTSEQYTLIPVVMGVVARVDESGQIHEPHQVLAGQSLAADSRQILRVWDRHEITIEPGTRLVTNQTDDRGCMVALMAGQITVSVNRATREGLFRVVTPQADLAVTGTVFTVTSTFDHTHLSVTQGTVRMSTPSLAGQSSSSCTMVSASQAFTSDGVTITRADSTNMSTLLVAAEATKDPVAILQHSPWYQPRFAPLIYLRNYLTRQGVQADDITLLAISGDLWCLQYPKSPSADLPTYIHRKAGLDRAAKYYGYEVQWLTPASPAEAKMISQQATTADELVLAFGLDGHPVELLSTPTLIDRASADVPWSYRFLSEDQPDPLALCRITRSNKPVASARKLAASAVADMRHLLSTAEDSYYLIGQRAVAKWGEGYTVFDRGISEDLLFMELNLVAKLSTPCEERLSAALGIDIARDWRPLGTLLDRFQQDVLSDSVFKATPCGRAQHQLWANGLLDTLTRVSVSDVTIPSAE